MFERIAHLVTRRPRLILAVAGLAMALAAIFGSQAPGKLKSAGFVSASAPSQLATNRLDTSFGGSPNLIFLVTARSGTVDDPAVAAAGRTLATRLATSAGVSSATSYWSTGNPALESRDRTEALVLGYVIGDDKTVRDHSTALVSELSTPPHAAGVVTVRAGGTAGTNDDISTQVATDLKLAEAIAIPLTLVLLIFAFGSVVAALLPIAIGVLTIMATLAALFILGTVTDVSVYALNLTTALGLGLAIDYALLMVNRYREVLAAGQTPADAVRRAVGRAGRTIVFSAAAVATALAALLVFPVYFLRSFAYAGISVVLVASLAAVIVLPALLAILGPRVNALAVRSPLRLRAAESPFWRRAAAAVMARPIAAGLPVVLVLVALGLPFLHVHFGQPDDRALPTSVTARQVGDALRVDFPTNANNTLNVVTTAALSPAAASSYSRKLSAIGGVDQVSGPAGVWAEGKEISSPGRATARYQSSQASWFSANITADPLSGAAQSVIQRVRAAAVPGDVASYIGGPTASLVDQKHDIGSRLPLAALLIVVTTFAVLFLFTRSILLPLKALILSALSLTAVFGTMVWIFQDGHLSGILGFTPSSTSTTMPLLLFCVAFGLSMDYEVFLLSRIKELRDAGATNAEAVAGGLARTGQIVTTAAALLAVTFFALGLVSKVSFIQLFGIGTGLAIVVDATLIRGVLVPAFMRLAGDANWWVPTPLRRRHRRLALSEGGAA